MKELRRIIKKGLRNPTKIYKAPKLIYNALTNVKYKDLTLDEFKEIESNSLLALNRLSSKKSSILVKNVNDLKYSNEEEELAKLFNKHGSDKASVHYYHRLYFKLFQNLLVNPSNIFEIGLGTNFLDVKSNMGIDGKPGASLRAFRDYLPMTSIFGADIDRRVLFEEERIKTYFVDQTDVASFNELSIRLKETKFDLMIDDGLHNSWANLNSLGFFLKHIKDEGIMLIEDIKQEDLAYYKVLSQLRKDLKFVWMEFNILYTLIIARKEVRLEKIFD